MTGLHSAYLSYFFFPLNSALFPDLLLFPLSLMASGNNGGVRTAIPLPPGVCAVRMASNPAPTVKETQPALERTMSATLLFQLSPQSWISWGSRGGKEERRSSGSLTGIWRGRAITSCTVTIIYEKKIQEHLQSWKMSILG